MSLSSLAVAYLPYSARIARGAVLAVKESQYVEAAKASGASDLRVIGKYIMPNITAPISGICHHELCVCVCYPRPGCSSLGWGPGRRHPHGD